MGGTWGAFFFLHNSRESIVLATSKFKDLSCRCSDTEMGAALKATEIILIQTQNQTYKQPWPRIPGMMLMLLFFDCIVFIFFLLAAKKSR